MTGVQTCALPICIPIEVVDIDNNKELAIQYRVRSVPTMIMVDEKSEVKRMTGVQAKNLVEAWLND